MDKKTMTTQEKRIFNRGISAGYFDIDIEDTTCMEKKEQDYYDLGVNVGKMKRIQRAEKEGLGEDYLAARNGYVNMLEMWFKEGEIKIKPVNIIVKDDNPIVKQEAQPFRRK